MADIAVLARAKVAGFKITSKKMADRFLDLFNEFEIYSWNTECDASLLWFRYNPEAMLPYTINHEFDGTIGASRQDAVDYIYRNRKYFNFWIANAEKEAWITSGNTKIRE